jgi:hypothetical protein
MKDTEEQFWSLIRTTILWNLMMSVFDDIYILYIERSLCRKLYHEGKATMSEISVV